MASTAFTVTLLGAVGITGGQYTIKRVNSGGNNVVVATTSGHASTGRAR